MAGRLPSSRAAPPGGSTYHNPHGASMGTLNRNSHGLSTKGSGGSRSSKSPRRTVTNPTRQPSRDQCGSLVPIVPSPSCVRVLCSLLLVGSALTTLCVQFHAVQRATTAAINSDQLQVDSTMNADRSVGAVRRQGQRRQRQHPLPQHHESPSQSEIRSQMTFKSSSNSKGSKVLPQQNMQATNSTLSQRHHDDGNNAAYVLPHVFDRYGDNRWEPPLDSIRDLNDVDARFFRDNSSNVPTASNLSSLSYHRPVDPSVPSREFLGFIRITKTASSSIIRFLQGAQHLRASNNFLDYDDFWKAYRASNTQLVGHPQAPACFFSRPNDDTVASALPPKELGPWNCPHFSYSHLIMNWSKTLKFLNSQLLGPSSAERDSATAATQQHVQVQFRIFTIVRDPFDRMTSYYHFWRKIYPDWLPSTPSHLLPFLIGGDYAGWMQHRANTTVPNLDCAHQYLYLSQDVNRAIRLVTASASEHDPTTPQGLRIVPLVSECFDASISLLVEMFPNVLEAGIERSFLNSTSKMSNERLEPDPEKGMVSVKEYNATRLYEQSQEWFVDEFRFYDAAVSQFRQLLLKSSVDPGITQQCIATLDERERRRTRRQPISLPSSSSSPLTTTAAST